MINYVFKTNLGMFGKMAVNSKMHVALGMVTDEEPPKAEKNIAERGDWVEWASSDLENCLVPSRHHRSGQRSLLATNPEAPFFQS